MNTPQLTRLHDLAAFLNDEANLKTHLDELATRAATVTDATNCSIMLLSEGNNDEPRLKLWASTRELPSAAWNETPRRGESIAGRVLEQGRAIIIADIARSEFSGLARRRSQAGNHPGGSFICAPIKVEGQIIGVINLSNDPAKTPFSELDLEIVGIMTALIAKSVQVDRMQMLLRSRLAQFTLAKVEQQVASQLISGAIPPSRIAKLLAKSFYRDLASAGFEPGQIVEAASEIIALISTDVARAKKYLAKDGKP